MEEKQGGDVMTTDDLRASASCWTLAGDVGLLAHLNKFSQRIIKNAEETESALNGLVDAVEETSATFNNISNQFLALQNSQFIENRVYEDDSPTDQPIIQEEVVGETQQETLARYREAVAEGLRLLDTHYEQVDVPESSDSDDDHSPQSRAPLLVRPVPVYTRPLPLLIGSAEWWADDSVGLGEYQENKDTDSGEESEGSEVDANVPNAEQRYRHSPTSSSSSEVPPPAKQPFVPTSFVPPLDNNPPPISAASVKHPDHGRIFPREDDLFGNYKTDMSRGHDMFGSDESINRPRRELFSPSENDLFDDPPITVQSTSTNVAKSSYGAREGLFGEKEEEGGLFGERDLVRPKPVIAKVPSAFTKELVAKLGIAQSQMSSDIVEPSEDQPKDKTGQSQVKSSQTSVKPSLFDDDTTDLFKKPNIAKRSTAVDVIKSGVSQPKLPSLDLFGDNVSQPQPSIRNWPPNNQIGKAEASQPNPPGLDLFGDDKSQPASNKPKRSTGDQDQVNKLGGSQPKPSGLDHFDDENAPHSTKPNRSTVHQVNRSGTSQSKLPGLDLFGDDDSQTAANEPKRSTSDQVNKSATLQQKPPKLDLFGDDDDSEDLFGSSYKVPIVVSKNVSGLFDDDTDDLFANSKSSKMEEKEKKTANVLLPNKKDSVSKRSSHVVTDLFADDDDIDLFSPSVRTSKVTFSNDSGTPDTSRVIASSTPGSGMSKPAGDLFGGLSEVDDSTDNNLSKVSLGHHDSHFEADAADNAILEDTKDHGFTEDTNFSDNVSGGDGSTWFQPQLSSTHSAAGVSNDTSGYRTGTIAVPAESAATTNSTATVTRPEERLSSINEETTKSGLFGDLDYKNEPLSSKLEDRRVSSVYEDNSKSRLFSDSLDQQDALENSGNARKTTKPLLQEKTKKMAPLKDDLFSSNSASTNARKSQPASDHHISAPSEDLFGSNLSRNKNEDLFGDTASISKPNTSLFDDYDDNSLFSDNKNKGDSGSVSSSKSSIFEEPNAGKSALSRVFDKKPTNAPKGSLFEDLEDDYDLFSSKTKNLEDVPAKKNVSKASNILEKRVETDSNPIESHSSLGPMIKTEKREGSAIMGKNDDLFASEENKTSQDQKPVLVSKGGSPVLKRHPPNTLNVTKTSDLLKDDVTRKSDLLNNDVTRKSNLLKDDVTKKSDLLKVDVTKKSDLPDGEVANLAVKKKIGKLNIPSGLNINTAALMPGAKPTKANFDVPTTTLPVATDSSSSVPSSYESNIGPSSSTIASSSSKTSKIFPGSSNTTTNEPLTSPDNLLHSTLRDRARIQVKRRPQTRKARHEALRTSGIDFTSPVSPGASFDSNNTQFYSAENTPSPEYASTKSNPLSTSTDGEDCFKVPELDSAGDNGLFKGAGDALFGVPPVLSPGDVLKTTKIGFDHEKGLSDTEKTRFDELVEEPKVGLTLFDEMPPITAADPEDDDLFADVYIPMERSEPKIADDFERSKQTSSLLFDEVPPIITSEPEVDDLFEQASIENRHEIGKATDNSSVLTKAGSLFDQVPPINTDPIFSAVSTENPDIEKVSGKVSADISFPSIDEDLFGASSKAAPGQSKEVLSSSQSYSENCAPKLEVDTKKDRKNANATLDRDVVKKVSKSIFDDDDEKKKAAGGDDVKKVNKVSNSIFDDNDDDVKKKAVGVDDVKKVNNVSKRIFDDNDDDVKKKAVGGDDIKKVNKVSKSIFDDDDDDDDLFSTSQTKKQATSWPKPKVMDKKVGKSAGKSESLFGESDDDDDMFSGSSKIEPTSKKGPPFGREPPSFAPVTHSRQDEPKVDSFFDDPLGLRGN